MLPVERWALKIRSKPYSVSVSHRTASRSGTYVSFKVVTPWLSVSKESGSSLDSMRTISPDELKTPQLPCPVRSSKSASVQQGRTSNAEAALLTHPARHQHRLYCRLLLMTGKFPLRRVAYRGS